MSSNNIHRNAILVPYHKLDGREQPLPNEIKWNLNNSIALGDFNEIITERKLDRPLKVAERV